MTDARTSRSKNPTKRLLLPVEPEMAADSALLQLSTSHLAMRAASHSHLGTLLPTTLTGSSPTLIAILAAMLATVLVLVLCRALWRVTPLEFPSLENTRRCASGSPTHSLVPARRLTLKPLHLWLPRMTGLDLSRACLSTLINVCYHIRLATMRSSSQYTRLRSGRHSRLRFMKEKLLALVDGVEDVD